jgi:ferredoxin-NADP reductase
MSIVKKYRAKVEKIINPISDIFTVTFSSDKKFQYNPGQFLHLALDEYDGIGQWPESRCFSMQSSPTEETLKITFAVKGSFTNRMKNELHEGKEIWLKLPYGELFTQPHNKVNTVFIAGGTGITPFLSLFADESFNEYINPRIYLGFRSKKYNIYENELREIRNNSCNSNNLLKVYYEDKDGIIDIKTILKENGTNSDYFISGPPIMIKSFKSYLINSGLPEQKVLTDEWE